VLFIIVQGSYIVTPTLTTVTEGGSADPDKNILLSNALKKAKEQGVPKENIAKSLARVKHLALTKVFCI
jgi:transcriptional/translational regulatory protein YebC/TACO1